jgi:thiamine-phosphate pyrophosphorylase
VTANSLRPADRAHGSLPPLYPIVDIDLCRMRGREPIALAAALADGGAQVVQLRQKSAGSARLLTLCRDLVRTAHAAGMRVILNDRADLAAMAGADGVHIGQEDLPVPAVRGIIGPGGIIGLSTHTASQVDAALTADIDYLAVGPIFRTATKDTGYEPRGLDLIRHAAGRGRPVVAIGGITLANAAAVFDAGASSIAIISDLLTGADPAARARQFLALAPPPR